MHEEGRARPCVTTQGRKGLWLQGELHQLVLRLKKKKKKERISNLYTSHLLQPTNEMPRFEEGVVSSFSVYLAIFKHVLFPDM